MGIVQRQQPAGFLGPDMHRTTGLDGVEIHVAAVVNPTGCPRSKLDNADHRPYRHHEVRRKVDQSVAHRRQTAPVAPIGTAISAEAVGTHVYGDDFDCHPVVRFNTLYVERATRTGVAAVALARDNLARFEEAGSLVVVIGPANRLDHHGLFKSECATDFAYFGVVRAGVVRGASEAAHKRLLESI